MGRCMLPSISATVQVMVDQLTSYVVSLKLEEGNSAYYTVVHIQVRR